MSSERPDASHPADQPVPNADPRPGTGWELEGFALPMGPDMLRGVWFVFIAAGMVGGVLVLPPEWMLIRRIAGGFFIGAGAALALTANRILMS